MKEYKKVNHKKIHSQLTDILNDFIIDRLNQSEAQDLPA